MGWCGGSDIMMCVLGEFPNVVANKKDLKELYKVVIGALWDQDWDCESDVLLEGDPIFEEALRELAPDYFEGLDEEEEE
jgi:hypothetical protein